MKRTGRMTAILVLSGYILVIYATLPLAPRLFSTLSKTFGGRLGPLLNSAMIGTLLILAYRLFRKAGRIGARACVGLAAVFSIYLTVLFCCTPIIAEKVHLVEYGFLGYLALRAFGGARSRDARYLRVMAVIAAVGYFDELLQGFLPNRVYDVRDICLNVLSGLLGLALIRLLRYEESAGPGGAY